ncbi:hypothetical protein [Micromonospora mirobrigensis]|uniref:Uncharacterized protein n=1 Tax=Micromonospora mirobrigensis TaxID=262898 RepID=A0A1C4URX7_9ACTN|nr:hypothetical protein [Micromonospora mirobrigensis]SCE74391.1 hypothetical protein GA0070564_101673 [Micromonospora mirobrigensis]
MGYRRKDARPRLALWMLVALGDAVLLLAMMGLSALVALLTVVALVGAGVVVRRMTRRGALVDEEPIPTVVARRRA